MLGVKAMAVGETFAHTWKRLGSSEFKQNKIKDIWFLEEILV